MQYLLLIWYHKNALNSVIVTLSLHQSFVFAEAKRHFRVLFTVCVKSYSSLGVLSAFISHTENNVNSCCQLEVSGSSFSQLCECFNHAKKQ